MMPSSSNTTRLTQPSSDVRRLYAFGAFHYDVAYQKTFAEYLPLSLEIIDAGLDLITRDSHYVFCIEQVILADAYWQRRPQRRAEFKQRAQEGRLIFCPGMWTMPDVNMPGSESFYQNALLGRTWLSEHLNVTPGPICWMADIAGHHPQIPQMCAQLGYSLYMFERGQTEDDDVVDFIWEGIDGTRILAHWEADTYYGLDLGLAWCDSRPEKWIRDRIARLIIAPLAKGASPLLLTKIGGDFRRPQERDLAFVNAWNLAGMSPSIQMAHPEIYVQALRQRTDLPLQKEDLNPLFQGIYSSRIRLKQFNQECEALQYACESLDAICGDAGRSDLTALWQRLCTIQFHDILWGSLADAAWKEAITQAESLHHDLHRAIRDRLAAEPGEQTILFNPLPYPRQEIVETDEGPQLVRLDGMQIATLSDVAVSRAGAPVIVKDRCLDNGLVTVEVDEYGRVASIRDIAANCVYEDKRHGYIHDVVAQPDGGDPWTPGRINASLLHTAPYADPAPPSATNQISRGLFETRGADATCFDYPDITMHEDANGLVVWCEVTYPARSVSIRYALFADEKLLRIRVTHRMGVIRTRLRAVMPTGIANGVIRREIPAGYVQQPQGEFPTQTWMDYANQTRGICVLNQGLPGNNTTDGVMLLSLFRAVAMDEPNVLPDYELDVDQHADYAMHPFTPGDRYYDPCRLGKRFNHPVLVAKGSRTAAHPRQIEFHGRVEPLAFRAMTENSVELRLHESSGTSQNIRITCREEIRSASLTTPLREILREINVTSRSEIQLTLRAFEIITIRLEFAQNA